MSRIGNKPIKVPEGVTVTVDGQKVTVKGPKGTLEKTVAEPIKVEFKDGEIKVTRPNDDPFNKSLHGLTRSLINNMVQGTVKEFERKLEINGIGYRVQKKGTGIVLILGYSHPVEIAAPAGISFDVPSQNELVVKGIDKELVGQTAAVIRTKRPPEVYKGKGIKYVEETIRRKEGKAGKK